MTKNRFLFALFACLLATALLTVGCGGSAGGDDTLGSVTPTPSATGNLAGSVNPTRTAASLRAQVAGLSGHRVLLQYYDESNNLENVPGVEPTQTDANGAYSFAHVPVNFFNLIIRIEFSHGTVLKGFIPALKANAETTVPEINETISSITLLLDKAASYRRENGIPGSCHINMGDIMSKIKPSNLVSLTQEQLANIAGVFIQREKSLRDNMNGSDFSNYRNAAFEKARTFCQNMARENMGSLLGINLVWEDFGKEMRTEMQGFSPGAVAIFQQADGLIASLPDKVPNLPDTIQEQIAREYEQNCFINTMNAILNAIRILSDDLLSNGSDIATIESGITTVTTTMEKASNEAGVSQAFTGNYTPDLIYGQIKSIFTALGLLEGTPPLITSILPTTKFATNDPAANRKLAMQAARTNLDTLLSRDAILAGKLDTEEKKQALVFLLFALGDIGIPLPFDPGQTDPGPIEPIRDFFGLLLKATDTYSISSSEYPYVIVPPPGFPPPPENWGGIVFVRPNQGIDLDSLLGKRVRAIVTIEETAHPAHAPAGLVTDIKTVDDIYIDDPVEPQPMPMQGKIARDAAGVICFYPGGMEEGFLILGATQDELMPYLDKWISVIAYPIQEKQPTVEDRNSMTITAKPVFKFDMSTIKIINSPVDNGGFTPIDSGTTQMVFGNIKPLEQSLSFGVKIYTHVFFPPMTGTVSGKPLLLRADTNVVIPNTTDVWMIQIKVEATGTAEHPPLALVLENPTLPPTAPR